MLSVEISRVHCRNHSFKENPPYLGFMKKVYLIGVLSFTCAGAYSLVEFDNAECSSELTSVDCPCTPDCMPGDAWCTCPQTCSN
jgi:hypothetical protein